MTDTTATEGAAGLDPAMLDPPWPLFEAMREHAPVFEVLRRRRPSTEYKPLDM